MKIALLGLLGALCLSLDAQEGGKERWVIAADFKIISLPQDLAVELVPALQDEATAEAGHASLRAALSEGRATLVNWSRGQSLAQRHSGMETMDLFRYPIEWNKVYLGPGSGAFPAPTAPVKDRPSGSLIPTSIGTQNLGTSFYLFGFASADGKSVHAQYASERTQPAKWTALLPARTLSGLTIRRDLPRFETHKAEGSVSAPSGRWLVIGTFKSQNVDRQIDLHLLRVTAIPAGKP